jgi:hypothetical protein
MPAHPFYLIFVAYAFGFKAFMSAIDFLSLVI